MHSLIVKLLKILIKVMDHCIALNNTYFLCPARIIEIFKKKKITERIHESEDREKDISPLLARPNQVLL